jgi:16S rRNA (guanine966-N2)-methyltransferase
VSNRKTAARRNAPAARGAEARVLRIIGGTWRGRKLRFPAGTPVRPTPDRVRETLFNWLGARVAGARCLDLFAGSGALGIEALSRGAAFALFIDEGAEARALIRENVATLGLGGSARIFRRDATKLGPAQPLEPFSLIFLDPPYGKGLAEQALTAARDGGWLTPDALIVVEESTKAAFAAPPGFTPIERRPYDETEFIILRLG